MEEWGLAGDPGLDFAAELEVGMAYENEMERRLPGVFAETPAAAEVPAVTKVLVVVEVDATIGLEDASVNSVSACAKAG